MSNFYNKQGEKVDYKDLDDSYCRIGRTYLSNGNYISTVFLRGISHGYTENEKPILFESMLFVNGQGAECVRCSTELEAIENHRKMVMEFEPNFRYCTGHNDTCCEFIDIVVNPAYHTFYNRLFICKLNPSWCLNTFIQPGLTDGR